MKRRSAPILLLAASLGLVACATATNKPIAGEAPNSDRRIAQQATIETVPGVAHLPKVCGHAPEAAVSARFDSVALTAEQYAVTRYTIRTPIYSCETSDGDGKGGDWGGFYDQSGNKADQLASAIKGVGKKISPPLVPYFQRGKPRSWRAFSDLIIGAAKEIQAEDGIDPSWTGNVLKQYKKDNMENLGYLSGRECTITGYNEETYEDRAFLQAMTAIVDSSVEGSKLLPGECDSYKLSWDGREVVGSATSDANRYTATVTYGTSNSSRQGRASVAYFGKRQAIAPGGLIEIRGSTAVGNAGAVQLTIRNAALNAMMAVPSFASACKLSASVVISARKGSAWGGKKTSALKSSTFPLDGNSAATIYTVDGVALAEKQHPVVKVSTAFAPGCPYFNTSTYNNGVIEE